MRTPVFRGHWRGVICLLISVNANGGEMGGWGSGRRWSSGETTADRHQLDVRRLERDGLLGVRHQFTWQWSRRGEVLSRMGIRPEDDRLILSYRHSSHGGEWISQDYAVWLERTLCHYGGTRTWFLCPARGCGRRVAILYCGKVFACRRCYRLAYECQRESVSDRADRRAWKIRERCKDEFGCLLDPLFKPKGMHERTFRRLERDYKQACSESAFAFSARMGMSFDEALRLTE
jgi:hypothetical protein